MRFRRHRHDQCSLYAPCRETGLQRDWEAFKRAVDDPATRDATVRALVDAYWERHAVDEQPS